VKNRTPLVDGNQYFSGEGGGIQTAQIRGVYWSDVPGNPGWMRMMFMRFALSGVTGGQPVSVMLCDRFRCAGTGFRACL